MARDIDLEDVRRILVGHYTMPADSSLAGEKIVVVAYLVRHARGLFLFDTGIGEGHREADERYHPIRRRALDEALADAGVSVGDVTEVANCHFHLDHCGGNPRFAGVPIFAQHAEHEAAGSLEYTLPEVVDFPGARLELHDGEADVAPGIRIVPTPGHTPGHQSVVVQTTGGPIVIAGQAVNDAAEYTRAHLAWQVATTSSDIAPPQPEWVARFAELGPRRVFFAHDLAVWEPLR